MLESLFIVIKLQVCNFIKKGLRHRYLPLNIAKFLRTPILKNICKRLLLKVMITEITFNNFLSRVINFVVLNTFHGLSC